MLTRKLLLENFLFPLRPWILILLRNFYGWEIYFLALCVSMKMIIIRHFKSTFWILILKNGLFTMRWDLLIMWLFVAKSLILQFWHFVIGSAIKLSFE